MQQVLLEGIGEAGIWLASPEFGDNLARMIQEAFGSSWGAITVSLGELDRIIYGERGTLAQVIAISGIGLVAAIATAGGAWGMWRLYVSKRDAEARADCITREMSDMADLCHDAIAERRQLRAERSRNLSTVPAIVDLRLSEAIDAIVAIVERLEPAMVERPQNIAQPEAVAEQEILPPSKGRASAATIKPRKMANGKGRKVAATIAKPSDLRPNATLADVDDWTQERVIPRPGYEIGATSLYQDFCAWCDGKGIVAVKQRSFGDRLAALKFEKETRRTVVYHNIALKPDQPLELKVVK